MLKCMECEHTVEDKHSHNLKTHLITQHGYDEARIEKWDQERKLQKAAAMGREAVICQDCGRVYGSNKILRFHRRQKHFDPATMTTMVKKARVERKEKRPKEATVVCPMPGCQTTVLSRALLCAHAAEAHAVVPGQFEIKQVVAKNIEDFEKWREQLEHRTVANFMVESRKRASYCMTRYYWCRQGARTSNHSSGLKKVYRIRQQRHCTAFITARIPTDGGRILIEYCEDHLAHDHSIRHLRIPDAGIRCIEGLLQKGIPPLAIVRAIRKRFPPAHRMHYITYQNVMNIRARLQGQRDRSHSEGMKEEHREEVEGVDVEEGEEEDVDMDDDADETSHLHQGINESLVEFDYAASEAAAHLELEDAGEEEELVVEGEVEVVTEVDDDTERWRFLHARYRKIMENLDALYERSVMLGDVGLLERVSDGVEAVIDGNLQRRESKGVADPGPSKHMSSMRVPAHHLVVEAVSPSPKRARIRPPLQ